MVFLKIFGVNIFSFGWVGCWEIVGSWKVWFEWLVVFSLVESLWVFYFDNKILDWINI